MRRLTPEQADEILKQYEPMIDDAKFVIRWYLLGFRTFARSLMFWKRDRHVITK